MRKTHKSTARLVLRGVGKMDKSERKQLAKWLKQQAVNVKEIGHLYTEGRFTATLDRV